ncbi:hypothetical protein LV78_002719 [Actinosynnema pretiosum]|nr:hypothetical protein [Actinosynnema pretiosum]
MSDGFMEVYQTGWSAERAAARVAALEAAGAVMANPVGVILTGDYDDQGEPIPVQREEVVRRLALQDRESQYVVWWLGPYDSFSYTVYQVTPEVVLEQFSLPGSGWVVLTNIPEEQHPVVMHTFQLDNGEVILVGTYDEYRPEVSEEDMIKFVLNQVDLIEPSVVGLSIDPLGRTHDEFDMGEVVLGGDEAVTFRPRTLLLLPEVAVKHPELDDWERRPYGRFTAFGSVEDLHQR